MVDVVPHEGGDHVVTVVVKRLQPHLAGVACLLCCCSKVLWLQLVVKEGVGRSLVDQDTRLGPGVRFDKLSGIVILASLHRAKISSEGLPSSC